MRTFGILAAFAVAVLTALTPATVRAGEVTIAVASNFLPAAELLAEAFETETDDAVVLTHGSTGQIFAQIVSGAPFDIFLAADDARPAELAARGLTADVRPYALGRLVLVSREAVTREAAAEMVTGANVALADPLVAPYGLAATAAMEGLGMDTATFQPILVGNVGQAATVFRTGNADFAFVAASLLERLDPPHVLDLTGLYPEIRQDGTLLARASENATAAAFWAFLGSDAAAEIIAASGFDLPE
ncbi:molybdate ABC transporter substrate-binding protein [Alphaproteobacteria bacterium GH1-50]|uniref:Molybdate ABC transporter substrate-binding protein n=1 Tax=Kangsaoukella pontilimi TaxID=2691042 RepID=A0A7C9IF89_9RHOB|nr:molybdate ABC transporter substrate-binding protein [Kangsaoukella pontilimi]MXQ07187.1 molybdate ABC transporter substrate-binding protein [Kangsaoukella pontilimi]